MAKLNLDAKAICHFRCANKSCKHKFEASPDRTIPDDTRPWHPFRYFAACPICGEECKQAHWEVALAKAFTNQTGPRTPEGKAQATKNLEGHPTPEETKLTRFNALKHGMSAKVATFWPARPGKYAQCDTCEMFDTCKTNPACMKKVELYMKHHVAFATGDPSMLSGLRATMQANIQAVIDDMFLAIIKDGARLKTPKWYYDKDGICHVASINDPETGEAITIHEIQAHPLIKMVGDLIAKNGMTLADTGMTPRQSVETHETERDTTAPTGDELREWKVRSDRQQEQLMKMIQRSQNVIDVTPEVKP